MGYEEARRHYMEQKFMALELGEFDEMDDLTLDQLEDLVDELTNAMKLGRLNLETEQGMTVLQEIIESYIKE